MAKQKEVNHVINILSYYLDFSKECGNVYIPTHLVKKIINELKNIKEA